MMLALVSYMSEMCGPCLGQLTATGCHKMPRREPTRWSSSDSSGRRAVGLPCGGDCTEDESEQHREQLVAFVAVLERAADAAVSSVPAALTEISTAR